MNRPMKSPAYPSPLFAAVPIFCIALFGGASLANAQTFNSGSTGADGALSFPGVPSGTVVEFNPANLHVNGDPNAALIDPEHDNVYNFTTIDVPAGVTVHLSAKYNNGAVYWLATGAVTIEGTVDLSGETGQDYTRSIATRRPAIPGPGGFPGGIGGTEDPAALGYPQPGAGPGGGSAFPNNPGICCDRGGGGTNTATKFLVPLIGGSGGGGAGSPFFETLGSGGGAGGGALLVASNTSIGITGAIIARGGASGYGSSNNNGALSGCQYYYGGGGGGGSIRLAAPAISGGGTLDTTFGQEGHNSCSQTPMNGGYGQARIEAFQQNWTFNVSSTNYTTGSPLSTFVPTTPPPSLQVTGVAGQAVAPNPTGSFDLADVTINSTSPVDVTIHGHYVPLGTKPTLYLFSLEGTDQVIQAQTGLDGTLADSITTLQVTFPSGFTRGYVRATWTSQ